MEIIEQLLSEKFTELRTTQSAWALGALSVLVLSQILLSLWMNKRLSRFNSTLQKSEIKFSKFHTDQIEAYKLLYKHVYEYRLRCHILIDIKERSMTHENLKKNISNWIVSINLLLGYFRENRILFTLETVEEVEKDLKLVSKFYQQVVKEKTDIEDFEIAYYGDPMQMYGSEEVEVSSVKARLKKLKESDEYKESHDRIVNIASHIEQKYRNLTA